MIVAPEVLSAVVGGGVGFVAGAFAPSVGRKIKALFVKETNSAKSSVSSAVSAVANDVKKV